MSLMAVSAEATLFIPTLPTLPPADPLAHWFWRNPLPHSTVITGLAYGSDTFVAVGPSAPIMTSPDGRVWTVRRQRAPLWGVTYANGLFVAVGTNTIITSADGVTWTNRSLPGTENLLEAVTYGNGRFVAVGGSSP